MPRQFGAWTMYQVVPMPGGKYQVRDPDKGPLPFPPIDSLQVAEDIAKVFNRAQETSDDEVQQG